VQRKALPHGRIHALTASAAVLVAAVICLLTPVGARAVTYAISDAQGLFASCPANDDPCSSPDGVPGFWRNAAFRALTTTAARPVTGVRLSVKYNAVSTWNDASGCTLSNPFLHGYVDQGGRPHPAQQSWHDLLYGLRTAYADGLTPLVVIVGYGAGDSVKQYDGSGARGDPGEPDPTTTAGWWSYYCGVTGILNGIAAHLPEQQWPHKWEAWNEPNGGCAYLNNDCSAQATCALLNEPATNLDHEHGNYTCSATGRGHSSCAPGSPDGGAAKAACLWLDAEAAMSRVSHHAEDTVAAGTFSWPSIGYLEPYLGLLASQGHMPTTYSIHDYGDPAASGWLGHTRTDELTAFDADLKRVTAAAHAPAAELWVTESGVNLTDRDSGYADAHSLPCTGAPGSTLPFTLGACLDGDPEAQAASTQAFFDLPSVTSGPPVTAIYWYQFAGAPGGWDSGLLDSQGRSRAAYCVWTLRPITACAGDPRATR
jgi:hypothetical protein